MEVKNLFDTAVKQDIINRINKLTPQHQAQWGKMNVAQMLAHCQMPLGVATGKHKLKRNFLLSLIGPLFKKQLFNEQPFKKNLPTDKSFIIADPQGFETEKQKQVYIRPTYKDQEVAYLLSSGQLSATVISLMLVLSYFHSSLMNYVYYLLTF